MIVKSIAALTLALAALAGCSKAPAKPEGYLLTIKLPLLAEGERIDQFSIKTWEVKFKAVCAILDDWTITAGTSGRDGTLSGVAGHGASMVGAGRASALRSLAFLTIDGAINEKAIPTEDGEIPVTFSGKLEVWGPTGETIREVPVDRSGLELTPASGCPDQHS